MKVMNTKQKNAWFVAAIVFAALVTYYMWHYLFLFSDHLDLELGGDSSKNYFTYLYHCMYGNGIWFRGMNYPYGEHIVYVDGQPALSVTLAYLRQYFHFTREDFLTILHLLLAFVFFLGILFTYSLLRLFRVYPALAILFASFILILSPQVFRVFGHFGLSYFCIIPMIFFWTARYHQTRKIIYPVFLFIAGLIASFLHPYFGAVVLIWAGFYAMGYFLLEKDAVIGKIKHVLPLLVSVISVFGCVKLFMAVTDPVKNDRPVTPIGVLDNATEGRDIVCSDISPIWQWVHSLFPAMELTTLTEGYAYVGLAAVITVLAVVINLIVNRKNKERSVKQLLSAAGFHPVWLFITLATLLLGMGVPFVWKMDWLLDVFPVFKQFRSLGRFSWIFYYAVSVFAAVVISHWLAGAWRRKKVTTVTALASLMLIWGIDCYGYIQYARMRQDIAPFYYDAFFKQYQWTEFLNEHRYTANDFQAILLLPYFQVGTEKFPLNERMDWPMTLCMRASLETRLPIVNFMMSRSSWSRAAAGARLVGGPFTDKPILEQGSKPFLLMYYNAEPLDRNAEYLLKSADYIDSFATLKIYACYPDRIKQADKYVADSAGRHYSAMQAGDSCFGCTQPYFIDHFDTGKSVQKFLGTNAAEAIKTETAYASEFILDTPLAGETEYEFSAWVLLRREDYKTPWFVLDVLDSKDSILVRHSVVLRSVDNYGLWYRLANFVMMPPGTRYVKCMVVNQKGPTYAAMDELVLRPSNAVVISKFSNGKAMVNNHIYKK